MKFGVAIPTCTAGMMHPVPFGTAHDVIDIAIEAEQLGFYNVGGNDHLSTMRFVRKAWPDPPQYYEPLITLANVAARTSVLRLTTGIMVLPLRDPVLLAKQVATLDQLSSGRLTLGVAVGGYRDEFEAVLPNLKDASRADLIREKIEALRALFDRPRSTYHGRYVWFDDVGSFPKPAQTPLPIYSGGNVDGSIKRAAQLCQGWLPNTPDAARETFLNSSFDLFRTSLKNTMTKGVGIDTYLDLNLIGTPDQICQKVAAFADAGVEHLCALLFVANTVAELRIQMRSCRTA